MVEKYGRKVKKLMISEMGEILSKNKGFVIASIENISAPEMDKLRKKMRQSGSRYMVLKNRLADFALKETGMTEFADTIRRKKVLGVGVIKEDPVKIAKLMMEFSKKNEGFKISNGYFEGRLLTAERIKELSKLPGREQLLTMVVGMMNAPITGFVGVLSSILRSLLYALNAVKEKKEQTE